MPTGWFVIEPPTSGVMPPALRRAKAAFVGQQPTMGPLTPKLPKVLASLNGRVDPAGGIVSKMQRTKCSMAGTQTQYGTMGAKLRKPTANFAVENQGQMSASIKRTLSALNGKQTFTGALGSALRRAKATLAGSQNQSGAMISQSKRLASAFVGSTPLIVTNTLSGNSFDTNFWGQNWNSGVYLSSGKVYPNTVGGYYGWGKYYSGITCKTQFSANGAFVSAKASTAAIDDRGTLLCVGIDSPTAMTKVISLAVRPSQGANTVEINKGIGIGLLANANAPATPAANDIWWFGWKKVGSDYVYTGYQNGAVAITWTDTGGATFGVPGRYVGIGSCLIQSNFQNFQDQNGWIGTVTCGDNP